MDTQVIQALDTALSHWQRMAGASTDEAEESANEFEASFYRFIDAFREWTYGLEPGPQSLEALLELPEVERISDLLPAPLYLNFETEAELIVERILRVDDEKYD